MSGLTHQMQAFAQAKATLGDGRGTGLAAARAAGYRGSDATLKVRAAKLMKDGRVRAEIDRIRAAATEMVRERDQNGGLTAGSASSSPPIEVAALTLGRKLLLLAEIAENRAAKDADRIRAMELASRLDGDLSAGAPSEATITAATATAAATVVVWVGNGRGPLPPGTPEGGGG